VKILNLSLIFKHPKDHPITAKMIMSDILSLCLRVGELAFSATVAGLTGEYLHSVKGSPASTKKREIYTEVVAAIGILFSLLFLLPFAASFMHWPIDFLLFVLFMVAFGLLADASGGTHGVCGSIWNWNGITDKSACGKFKANLAFCFLASIFFLASALLGLYVTHKRRRAATTATTTHRRRWYRSRV